MSLTNSQTRYGSVAKFNHWIIFLMIAALLTVGFIMTDMEKGDLRNQIYGLHKSFGLTLLALAIFRVVWSLSNTSPGYAASLPNWQRRAAKGLHHLLYLLILLMPLSGWMMSSAAGYHPNVFGLFTLPMPFVAKSQWLAQWMNSMHEILAWVIVGAVSLHILAALKHHFVNKDDILVRMLPGQWRR